MLRLDQVNEIRRLLAEGRFSRRAIARMTGVSRSSVGLIARGRWNPRQRAEEQPAAQDGPVERCTQCGGLGTTPCRRCIAVAALLQGQRKYHHVPEADCPLELHGETLERYEQLRAFKQSAAGQPAIPTGSRSRAPHPRPLSRDRARGANSQTPSATPPAAGEEPTYGVEYPEQTEPSPAGDARRGAA